MLDIESIEKEYNGLLNQLSDPGLISDWERFEELSRKKEHLEKIINKHKELEETKKKIEENKAIIASGEVSELVILAQDEISSLVDKREILEKEFKQITSTKANFGKEAAIIEIRAGTGGDEAALFAGSLFKMYSRYADLQEWNQRILNSHPTELKGFKEIIFELKGEGAYSKMKYEGGVHRVQRIPETEKSGRVHTSTATVAVLLKPKREQIKIRPDDLQMDFFKASGPGGQYVNKRMTAVRITHIPTGIAVASQTERNQVKNKENALSILEAKILEKKEMEEIGKMSDKRNIQVGQAKRSEKIRTYNFPQDRMTDHRVKKSWHNISAIMNGDLNPIIEELNSSSL